MKKYIFLFLFILIPSVGFSVESICPGGSSPDPNVVFCDDFDDGSWLTSPAWDASEGLNAVECGGERAGFNSNCAAYTGTQLCCFDAECTGTYDAKFGGILFPGEGYDELYYRVYVKTSSNWTPAEVADKGLYLEGLFEGSDVWNMKLEYSVGSADPNAAGYAGFASYAMEPEFNERLGQNINPIRIQAGKWYLFEFRLKPNTGDNFDGIVQLWIDDASVPITSQTLRMSYNNVRVRKSSAGNGTKIRRMWVFWNHKNNGGCGCLPLWGAWDQVVISQARIGPLGISSGDISPPSISNHSPAPGATNWSITDQNVSFTLTDETAVDSSTLKFFVTGESQKICDSGLTCTPTGDPTTLNVSYVRGSDWVNNTTYTLNVDVYDTLGYRQQTNWQFTTEVTEPDTIGVRLNSYSPLNGATIPITSRQITFELEDNIFIQEDQTILVIWEGAVPGPFEDYLCGNPELSCSWVVPNLKQAGVYTRPTDWLYGTTYTARIRGWDNSVVSTDDVDFTWTFTTEGAPQPPKPPSDIEIHVESP